MQKNRCRQDCAAADCRALTARSPADEGRRSILTRSTQKSNAASDAAQNKEIKMKTKILHYVLAVVFALLSGCAESDYTKPLSTAEVDIKGHHYLVLREDGNFGQTYVHDPDCLMKDIGRKTPSSPVSPPLVNK